MITYRLACTATALVLGFLCVVFIVAPATYIGLYGVSGDDGAIFLGQRAAPLLLGLTVILWGLKDHHLPVIQRVVCLSMIVVFGGIAVSGMVAFLTEQAEREILIAVLAELIGAIIFADIWRRIENA